ncbi:MAG: hypothetical protein ACU0DI_08060 [Paracoccaceae bacterium]
MRISPHNTSWFDVLSDDDVKLMANGRWPRRRAVTRADQLAAPGHSPATIDLDI